MVGLTVRPFASARLLLSALLVLLLVATLAPPPVAAGEADESQAAETAATDSVPDFPGEVGQIVQNLTDQLVPTRRYRGAQRFDTAALIAEDAFDDPSDVVIARGDLFPDALSGSFLAGQLDAPILLTSSHRLEPDTLAALEDLDPDRVTLLGGTSAIAFGVAVELGQRGFPTTRVGGVDRFETAALAATAQGTEVGEREAHGRTAIVARADEFADALVAGTLSYTADYPLLLTRGDELHPDTAGALDELAIDHVIVPGGQAAVSDDVVAEIVNAGIHVERISGVDRVATSVEFAQFMRDELGFGLNRINAAVGTRFPDALALAGLSGATGQPIVLTAGENSLGGDGAVEDFLSQTCVVDLAGIAGGHAAISTDLEQRIRTVATATGAPCQLSLEPTLALRDLGADHTLTGRLADNAGEPVAGEDVRVEVYRASDLQLPVDLDLGGITDLGDLGLPEEDELTGALPADELLGELEGALDDLGIEDVSFDAEPAHTFVDETDENGEVEGTYTGPELPALDIAVACLDDEAESCALLSNGVLDVDPNLLTASAVTLWAVDVAELLPNLLLLDPPLAVEESGGSHEVTATALEADLADLEGDADLASLLDPSSIDELGDLDVDVDPDALGERVAGEDVKFEVYRATDVLPDDLLEGLVGLLDTLEDGDDIEAALLELLGDLDPDDLLGLLEPVAEGTDVTDENGEATFSYDGPAATELGLDVIVACFGDGDAHCTAIVDGDLELPDEPATAVAAALWVPDSTLDGLLEGLIEELLGLLDDPDLISDLEDAVEGLLDEGLLDEDSDLIDDGGLIDDLLNGDDDGLLDDDDGLLDL